VSALTTINSQHDGVNAASRVLRRPDPAVAHLDRPPIPSVLITLLDEGIFSIAILHKKRPKNKLLFNALVAQKRPRRKCAWSAIR
jgi:hypothetical protein